MMPGYRFMDSYPHQMNQVPLPHYYFPGFGNIPPQMRVDAFRCPMKDDIWPTGGNHEHIPCHGCCNHGCSRDCYGFRPPFPAVPSFNGYGNYFMYPPPCNIPTYYVPPLHLSTEQPRYEYEKYVPNNYHCCGCPTHMCNQKSDGGVKIEEQEPEVEKRKNDFPLPVQTKGIPYPVAWVPPEYMQNQRLQKLLESEVTSPNDAKLKDIPKPPEREPKTWSGWIPYDINNLRPLTQDWKKNQSTQGEEKVRQFPFPIIWMPSYGKQQEDEKKGGGETNSAPKCADEQSSNFKCLPGKLIKADHEMDKSRKNEEISGNTADSGTQERTVKQKSIPVRQLDKHDEKDSNEDSNQKMKDVSGKLGEDNKKDKLNKPSEKSTRKGSSSPLKTSHLPPVCLRVDPLPRKKNGNGSSRSPSPPCHKGRTLETVKDCCKTPASPSSNDNIERDEKTQGDTHQQSNALEPNVTERENTLSMGKTAEYDKEKELKIESVTQSPNIFRFNFQGDGKKDLTFDGVQKDKAEYGSQVNKKTLHQSGSVVDETAGTKEATKAEYVDGKCSKAVRRKLSDVDAAILIQSAYRGYEVRKWEPLKKLKQIAKVREQMFEVKSRVQALEISCDLKKDDRQRVVIGEMIMNLLLKLDAIQGLHPSLRDWRKSLARELVALQEKLDTLRKPKEELGELSTAKSINDLTVDALRVEGVENKEAKAGESSDKNCYNNIDKLTGPGQDELRDGISKPCGSEFSEPVYTNMEVPGIYKDEIHEAPVTDRVAKPVFLCAEHQVAQVMPTTASEIKANYTEPDVAQVETAGTCETDETSVKLEQSLQDPSAKEEKTNSKEDQFAETLLEESHHDLDEENSNFVIREGDDFKQYEVMELPQNVISEGHAAAELEENIKGREQGNKIEHGKKDELDNLIDVEKDPELLELPLGVIDEDEVDEKRELFGCGGDILTGKQSTQVDETPTQFSFYEKEAELDNWVKVGEEDLYTACKVEMDQSRRNEVHDENDPLIIRCEAKSDAGKQASDQEHRGENGDGLTGNNKSICESAAKGANVEDSSEEIEEEMEQQMANVQFEEPESVPGGGKKIVDLLVGSETANKEVPILKTVGVDSENGCCRYASRGMRFVLVLSLKAVNCFMHACTEILS
ncbi:BAG family molecular chaperone regulator 6 [Carica papaya]|uniref:BAG family molecular chaperone regulator 6 n=1 Tax=Carica papaya TaxID=3649 RepID=UPI000B8C89F7|nr:BAG family molecular chaperone regulator 6 [Carica papaya]